MKCIKTDFSVTIQSKGKNASFRLQKLFIIATSTTSFIHLFIIIFCTNIKHEHDTLATDLVTLRLSYSVAYSRSPLQHNFRKTTIKHLNKFCFISCNTSFFLSSGKLVGSRAKATKCCPYNIPFT